MYSLGRVLGRGGNATVYDAVDRRTGAPVAVKVVHSTDPDRAARLAREARAMTAIRHPNVCAILDSGILPDGRAFVVMERLEGESLREILVRVGRLEPDAVVDIAVQLLGGLGAAHVRNVIHRDVKPDNIFIVRTPAGPRVKLLDFGSCRRIDANDANDATIDSQALTLDGFVVGTPGYLSPEQAYGERDLDARVDLFSVGLVMFESLTGRPGFLGRTCSELMDVSQRIPSVLRYRTISLALASAVNRATEPVASKRYASAVEMRNALVASRREPAPARPKAPSIGDWDVPTQRRDVA